MDCKRVVLDGRNLYKVYASFAHSIMEADVSDDSEASTTAGTAEDRQTGSDHLPDSTTAIQPWVSSKEEAALMEQLRNQT